MKGILSFLFISLSLALFLLCPKAYMVYGPLTMEHKESVSCVVNNGYRWVFCLGEFGLYVLNSCLSESLCS